MLDDLDADEWAVMEAAMEIRRLWQKKPVANDEDWHAAILVLVQAVDVALTWNTTDGHPPA